MRALSHRRFSRRRHRNLLHDFGAEAFEGGNLAGMVGGQANALEVQVRQDLRADADLQLPRCRTLHLNGALLPRDGHAVNAQRG